MNKFYERANTAESIAAQIQILNEGVCPNAPEPEACKLGVTTWWGAIVPIIFNEEAAHLVCHALSDECHDLKAWDCDTCLADIAAVTGIYKSEEAAAKVIEVLQGPAFCASMDLDADGLAYCNGVIEQFMPYALQGLFTFVEQNAQLYCAEVFDGICDAPSTPW